MNEKNICETKGFKNRDDYLRKLAEIHDIKLSNVKHLADDILRGKEDFDGLPILLDELNSRSNAIKYGKVI